MFNFSNAIDDLSKPADYGDIAHYTAGVVPAGDYVGGKIAVDGSVAFLSYNPITGPNGLEGEKEEKTFSTKQSALDFLSANYPPDEYAWAIITVNIYGDNIDRQEIETGAETKEFVTLEELQGVLPDGVPGWDYEAQNAALFSNITKDSTSPMPPGLPSPWWNPQGFMNVTRNGATLGMVPNWGQDIFTPLDVARPSLFFCDPFYMDMAESQKQTLIGLYGGGYSAVKSPAIWKHFKEQTTGYKSADEFTYWLCWLMGCTIFVGVTNDFKIVNTGTYYSLQEARIIDAFKYQYYKSRQPMPAQNMPFCTGNYYGWDFKYKNNAWFKLAVDTVTSWRFSDKSQIDIKTPFNFNYAPILFGGYNGLDGGAPDTQWEDEEQIKKLFPSFAYGHYKNNINLPSRFTLRNSGAISARFIGTDVDLYNLPRAAVGIQGDRMGALCLHYIVKYPEIGALPKPPYYTLPINENYQAGVNRVNMTRYMSAIISTGMQIDAGTELGEVRINARYFPALPEIEETPAWLDVVQNFTMVIGGFLLLLSGISALSNFSVAGLKAKLGEFSLKEAAKNWIMNKAAGYAAGQVTEYLTEDEQDAIDENNARIEAAREQAAQEQMAANAAANEAAYYEEQAQAARKKLTGRVTKSILALGTALLLAQLGG